MSHAIGILAAALLAILGSLQCNGHHHEDHHEKVTVVQDPIENRKVAFITWMNAGSHVTRCRISTDQDLIQTTLKISDEVVQPTEEEFQEMKEECDSLNRRSRRNTIEDDEEEIYDGPPGTEATDGWNVIFPGTKWCGAGDVAKHDDDLGFHEDTDRCCRAHDKCDDLMAPGETKNNLTNKSPFTALSCTCDNDFYDCLSRINSLTSNTIGNSYFNLLRRECYELDYPFGKKCKKYRTFLKITCLERERDTKKPKVYQWVKAKFYKQLPFPGPLTITLPF